MPPRPVVANVLFKVAAALFAAGGTLAVLDSIFGTRRAEGAGIGAVAGGVGEAIMNALLFGVPLLILAAIIVRRRRR